jgi:RNA polymerase sigma-70 factor, ECF subfamily
MTQSTTDDLELVRRCRQGEFAAFEELVSRYERRIFTLALRILGRQHDAEEAVQLTFLSVVEHVKELREQSRFSTWLMKIATNQALAILRKRSKQRTVPLVDDRQETDDYRDIPRPDFIAEWRETPEQIAARRETRQLLAEALEELDEKYRLVFVLRDVEGMSITETAEILGISQGNVKIRSLRARLMLRERLTREFGDADRQVAHDHPH